MKAKQNVLEQALKPYDPDRAQIKYFFCLQTAGFIPTSLAIYKNASHIVWLSNKHKILGLI